MHEFESLLRRLSEGRIGRRNFIKKATALGFAGKVKDDEFEVAGQMLELCGENFWRFYEDTEENRLRATGYLRGDLIATQDVAERMGIL